jgi:hypothetical protein
MIIGMAVVFDIFGAQSDAAAAELVDVGPSGASHPTPPVERPQFSESWTVTWTEDRPTLRTSELGILVLPTTDMHPSQMGTLEELLTEIDFDIVTDSPRYAKVLAESGDMFVLTLTDELQAALAEATPDHLVAVATPWALHDEVYAHGDPEERAHLLVQLAELARRTADRGERLYAWGSADAVLF